MTDPTSAAAAQAADAIRNSIRRKRSSLDQALDQLDPDARELWTLYLDDEVAAVAAGIRSADHLARAISLVSGVKVNTPAVRRWRDDRTDV